VSFYYLCYNFIMKKIKYVIFDFDGVIGNTWEANIQASVNLWGKSREETIKRSLEYFSKRPYHAKGSTEEDVIRKNKFMSEFAPEMNRIAFGLFEDFVKEIINIKNIKYAIVSSGSKIYILPSLINSKLVPTHILCSKESHSKEEKIELICKDWEIDIKDSIYITDTQADVYELQDMIGLENIYGCAWGFQGREALLQVLPKSQILNNVGDLSIKLLQRD
jgi:FMN phosphatase YigB (HAD superfamily)